MTDTTDNDRADPMKGLADYLRAQATAIARVTGNGGSAESVLTLRRWAAEVQASRPASAQAKRLLVEACPELNLSNYNADDVERLNDWAVRADAEIDRLAQTPAAKEGVASPGNCGGPANCLAMCSEHANCALKEPGQREVVAPGAAQPFGWALRDLDDGMGGRGPWRLIEAKWHRPRPDIYEERPLYTSPTAAPEGWRDMAGRALDALVAMQMEARARKCGLKCCDDSIDELRAALNREVEPRTVRMPLKEEQIEAMWLHRPFDGIAEGDLMKQLTVFTRAVEAHHGINSGTKGESK
jgi:hypothetical protein